MAGCFSRFLRFFGLIVVLALVGALAYFYVRRHPDEKFWKDGATAVQEKLSTATLGAEVKGALSLRQALQGLDISVGIEKDVVTLRGKVPSPQAVKDAENVAAAVPGVRQVVNFLEVDPSAGQKAGGDGRSMGERLDDEALELKVHTAFKLDKDLAAGAFDVKAFRKAVELKSALATAEQKKRALEVARSIAGVTAVDLK